MEELEIWLQGEIICDNKLQLNTSKEGTNKKYMKEHKIHEGTNKNVLYSFRLIMKRCEWFKVVVCSREVAGANTMMASWSEYSLVLIGE